jgi:cation-transporting ATPase F
VALNTVAVIQAFYLLNCRSLSRPLFSRHLFSNRWLWVGVAGTLLLQVALTHVPALNTVFRTAPLGADEWLRVLGAGVIAMLVVEAWKWGMRQFAGRR